MESTRAQQAGTVPLWLDLRESDEPVRSGRLPEHAAGAPVHGVLLGPATTVDTVRRACALLTPPHDGGRDGHHGTVVAAPPPPGTDGRGPAERAAEFAARVDRPRVAVALPATDRGIADMSALLDRGVPVQLATCYSVRRCEQAAAAYLAALRRAEARGEDLARLASTVAFGLRPLDVRVDALLDLAGGEEAKALRGTAALLTARLARFALDRVFDPVGSPVWRDLAAAGAVPLRLVWTDLGDGVSGGDPVTGYAAELGAPDAPVAVTTAALGRVAGLRPRPRSAHRIGERAGHLDACLRWFGICPDDVALRLEGEPLSPVLTRTPTPEGVA
ncbi:transaldolase family protein [Streptomyces sp. NPDC060184]|uniref:transaldolase family protein n=1 Tax=Streptomyces sp. NPDC060184 TaxID=3347064 RepID=UPI0036662510